MPNFPHLTFELIRKYDAIDNDSSPRRNWETLVSETPNGIDLEDKENVVSLHLWLNRLKCRLPSARTDPTLVRGHLVAWWKEWKFFLDELTKFDLRTISDAHVSQATEMLEHLQSGRVERTRIRHFGPVAASKTLMAINPNIFSAWDDKIAHAIYGGNTTSHYKQHLIETQKCAIKVFPLDAESALIDENNRIGIGKLIDEALYWRVSKNLIIEQCPDK